jgi:uncharacterized membrane protein
MDPISNRLSFRLTLAAFAAWLLVIVGLWAVMRGLDEHSAAAIFLGRFHILIVHIPIGLLSAALIFEVLGMSGWFPKLSESVLPCLWLGALGSMGATIAGYLLMAGEQIEGKDMGLHMWTGLGVVVLATLCLYAKLARLSPLVMSVLLLVTVGLTGASSHFGGNMVHDNDYLSEYAPDPLKPLLGHPAPKESVVANIPFEEWPIYDRIVQPIFDAKCTECHDENKVEGGLRMDSFAALAEGGDLVKDGDIPGEFVAGNAEESEVIIRVTMDPSEDDFMPPGKREHMTPEEIALVGWWINQGASPTMTVAQAKPDASVTPLLDELRSRHAK